MTDHKKPKLKLVKGKAKPRHRLTAKQSKFIDCVLGIGVDNPMTASLNRSHKIITGLEREANDFEHGSPTSRVRALELLGKLKDVRLFSSDISVEDSRSSDQIKEELEKKLKTLLGE